MNLIKYYHTLPSLYFFLLFSAGIAIGWLTRFISSPIYFFIVFILIFIFAVIQFKHNLHFFYALLIIIFLSGILRIWFAINPLSDAEAYLFKDNIIAFQGKVEDVTSTKTKPDKYLLKCEKVITVDTVFNASGSILINQGKFKKSFKYGDVLRITGKPAKPGLPSNPGEFNYRRYLQLNDIFFQFKLKKETEVLIVFSGKGNWIQNSIFNKTRNVIRRIFDKYLDSNSGAIVKALILGERGDIAKEVVTDFQKTGVIHVLAISGLHVAFIALFLQFILSLLRVPQKLNMALIVLFLVFFLALVNFKAPVVRASLMMSIYYIAKFTSRPQNSLNIVALSGIVILLVRPEELLLPGFQYSFTAVFGLIYGTAKLNSFIPKLKLDKAIKKLIHKYFWQPFIASFCAILATMPLTWFYFGTFQIGALIANIFVIPLIGFVVFLSIFLLIISSIKILPAAGVGALLSLVLDFLISLVTKFADFPFIQVTSGHPGLVLIFLIVIAIFCFFNLNDLKARLTLIAIILSFAIIFFENEFSEKKLRTTFISVGQGDAILIEFSNGKNALIDAGNKGFGFDAGERYVDPVLKHYGISGINYLIASHPHSDHIGGFEFLLQNYKVDTLIVNEFRVKSKIYTRILQSAGQKGTVIKYADEGDIIKPDRLTRIYVLHPDTTFEKDNSHSGKSINNSSLVFKLLHGENSILFNGDAEVESEKALLNYGDFLDCDILKVGHHGSKTSSSQQFLSLSKPEIAIISVGKKNKFKHPSPNTLEKFKNLGIQFYRTDISGAVIFESNGRSFEKIDWR